MNNNIVVIYDNRRKTNAVTGDVLNTLTFGDIRCNKTPMKDLVKCLITSNNIGKFICLENHETYDSFMPGIAGTPTDIVYIYIPSSLVMLDIGTFASLIRKLKESGPHVIVEANGSKKKILVCGSREISNVLKDMDKANFCDCPRENVRWFREDRLMDLSNFKDLIYFLQKNINSRHFNKITVSKNLMKKSSSHKEKIISEYSYYRFLPDQLKIFLLMPFGLEVDSNGASYYTERLNVLDLSLQWIYNTFDEESFKILLNSINDFLEQRLKIFGSRRLSKEEVDQLYVGKVYKRMESIKNTSLFNALNEFIEEKTTYRDWFHVIQKYEELYKLLKRRGKISLKAVISHGDMCFSNILYDRRIGLMKFIDPKGCKTKEGIYMQELYDIAKLSHSILGDYDFIIHGMCNISPGPDGSFRFEIPYHNHNDLKKIFKKHLEKWSIDYNVLRLVEASLFFSMLPFHMEDETKVFCLFLNGIHILDEVRRNLG
jgi:hypothetical protein